MTEESYIIKLRDIPLKIPDTDVVFKFSVPSSDGWIGLMYNKYVLTRHSLVIHKMFLGWAEEGSNLINCGHSFEDMFGLLSAIDKISFPNKFVRNCVKSGVIDLDLFKIANFYAVNSIIDDIHSLVLASREKLDCILEFYVEILQGNDKKIKDLVGLMVRLGTIFPMIELKDEVLLEISENLPATIRTYSPNLERNTVQLYAYNFRLRKNLPEGLYKDVCRILKLVDSETFCKDIEGMEVKILKYVLTNYKL